MNFSAWPRRPKSAATGPDPLAAPRLIFINRVYWPDEAATAQLLTDLAGGLAGKGWETHVIAGGGEAESHAGVGIHRAGPARRRHGLLPRLTHYLGFLLAARRHLSALLRPGDIVVLKTDPPFLAPVLSGLVRRRGGRLVHWIQDIYPEIAMRHAGFTASWLLRPWHRARDQAWRRASHCVVVGTDLLPVVRQAGVPASRVTVLPNWAPPDLDHPATAAEVAAIRRTWRVEGKFLAVYSGNLGRVHEFATLLDAAAQLGAERDLCFLFIGDGARFAAVRAAAAARGLHQVRFLPAQPRRHLAAALAAADVHFVTLLPGYESLVNPSKLAGVLAAGRPAIWIGSTASANARLLRDSGSGAAFAPGDAAALAATLLTWQADPVAAARRGAAARRCYAEHFTFAAALHGWETLLRRLAAEAE